MMEPETDLSFEAFSFHSDSAVATEKTKQKTSTDIIEDEEHEEREQQKRDDFAKKWLKMGKGWQKRFLIGNCLPEGVKPRTAAAQQLATQPWVFGAKSGCGCLPCSKAQNGTDWSLSTAGLVPKFRACFMQKHEESKQHIDAVKRMLGIGLDPPGAPSLEEFQSLLEKLQSGSSMRSTSTPIAI